MTEEERKSLTEPQKRLIFQIESDPILRAIIENTVVELLATLAELQDDDDSP